VDEGFEMHVFTDKSISPQGKNHENFRKQVSQCDMLVNVAVENKESVDWLLSNCKNVPNIISFESSPFLVHKLGGQIISDDKRNSSEVVKTVAEAWERHNADDIRFCILIIINSYIRPVSVLKNLRAKGLSTLTCMVKNCGPQIINCLLDSNCRKALLCLNSCSPTDQVCNYRCIASYESPNLEAFSLCVLQKHNCLELDAEIPNKPSVPPLQTFRGQSLNHDTAEDLFIGWLGDLEWSWRVIAGQNPAYDQFPCQYQLFYRGKAKGSFWYEPVFQVRTLDGNLLWRRRKYRVKRSTIPGTFYFTVLDNGVVSKEFWTIVDVAEDLSWGLFHYNGAASAAGLSYSGAVLVSPDGMYPGTAGTEKRIDAALEKCGIRTWELYMVDNCSCEGAPLGLLEGSRLHATISA
jgi:VDE lipocalin domain